MSKRCDQLSPMYCHSRLWLALLGCMSVLLVLSSCTANIITPTPILLLPTESLEPTETLSPTHTTTVTMTPTVTATATVTPTPTLVIPSGTLEALSPIPFSMVQSPYFADSTICELPCWNGLTPGISKRQDVVRVMQEIFGLDDAQSLGMYSGDADIPEMYWIDYIWGSIFADATTVSTNQYIRIRFWIAKNTDVVHEIGVRWINDPDKPGVELKRSMADFLRSMNHPPSTIGMELRLLERADLVKNQITMLYSEGIGVSFPYFMKATEYDSGDIPIKARMCLDEPMDGYAFVVEPFSSDLTGLSDIQEYLIGSAREETPIEQFTEYTPQEIYELVLDQPSVCLIVDWLK
jgi:hypothetical protein